MRTMFIVLTLSILFLTGCGTAVPTPTDIPAPVSSSPSSAGTFFSIDEIGLGPNGYVALTNFTDQPVNMTGLLLCQGAQCFDLPDVEVAPGRMVRIAINSGDGLENVIATQATIGELRPTDGELALYTSKDGKEPETMLTYLQWGSTPHDNTQTALDTGLWLKGSFAPTSENATRLFHTDGGLWLFDE